MQSELNKLGQSKILWGKQAENRWTRIRKESAKRYLAWCESILG
jgi:hypothetical protein